MCSEKYNDLAEVKSRQHEAQFLSERFNESIETDNLPSHSLKFFLKKSRKLSNGAKSFTSKINEDGK